MIQRHARVLLSSARLLALGKMAAALDLHLVAWLAGERERAARVDNAVLCIKRLHDDFAWPYPAVTDTEHVCGDSGYVSLPLRTAPPLSPEPARSVGSCSVAEGGGVAWATEGGEERRYAALMERLHLHQATRGSHSAHVQLRYFLQLMTEASCVEWAALIAVVLRDALAVLRCCNAARSHDVALPAVRRLRAALQQLAAWTDAECVGYKPFMLAISNQVPFLTSIINTRERRMSMIKSRVRTSSTGSLNQDTKSPVQETKIPPPQKAQEVIKQTMRKESPAAQEPIVPATVAPQRPPPSPRDDVSSGCAIM
ncbi:unnamed protein product [Diatraea saccharalis]|uniref:Ras-GEF domain-containing protein n=1 Tax=Diatraea saccharalis TaxID=40085 RepID=A0A9N9RDW9_9NEOP|nr:unnamed protein product [Diatraea saccharalis]